MKKRILKLRNRIEDIEHEIVWYIQHPLDTYADTVEAINKLQAQKNKLKSKLCILH